MELRDHPMSHSTSPPPIRDEAEPQIYHNDDLDDIFGSEPSSPTHDRQSGGNTEWSDIPRLKEKHETEGYRDGVGKGKVQTVQAGFDEGYSLGAVLGLRIGKVLGLLEGVLATVRSASAAEDNGKWKMEKERLEKLVGGAREELKTETVFGAEWWGEDGIWKFEVPREGDGREVLFPDVASAHPLVKKWEGVVEKEVERWGIDMGILDNELGDAPLKKGGETGKAPGAAKELSW